MQARAFPCGAAVHFRFSAGRIFSSQSRLQGMGLPRRRSSNARTFRIGFGAGGQIRFCFFDVQHAHTAQRLVLFDDVADFHLLVVGAGVAFQRHRDIVVAVKLRADDSRAKRVAVEPDHQVQHRGAVVGLDGARIFVGGENLLGKVERAVPALLEREAGVLVNVLQPGRSLSFCERMSLPQIGVYPTVDELVEFQLALL